MQNVCENTSLTSTLVTPSKRSNFLINKMGLKAIQFENKVYQWCDTLCPGYKGAYWEFYSLSNEGFYMAPDAKNKLELHVDGNGYTGLLEPETVGIIVTLFALSSLAFKNYMKTSFFADSYHQLRDFVGMHPDSSAIFSAID